MVRKKLERGKNFLFKKGKTLTNILVSPDDKMSDLIYDPMFSSSAYKNYHHDTYTTKKMYKMIGEFYKKTYSDNVYLGEFHGNEKNLHIFTNETNLLTKFRGKKFMKYKTNRETLMYNDELVRDLKRKNIVLFLPLKLNTTIGKNGHANMLVIYPKTKQIYRYEPHGKSNIYGDNIDALLKHFFSKKFKGYKYIHPTIICPFFGPQVFENMNIDKKDSLCLMWSYLFVIYSLDYPTLKIEQIFYLMGRGKKAKLNIVFPTNFTSFSKSSQMHMHDEIRMFINLYLSYKEQRIKFA